VGHPHRFEIALSVFEADRPIRWLQIPRSRWWTRLRCQALSSTGFSLCGFDFRWLKRNVWSQRNTGWRLCY